MVTGVMHTSNLSVNPSFSSAGRFTYYKVGTAFSESHPYLTKIVEAVYYLANKVLQAINYLHSSLTAKKVTEKQNTKIAAIEAKVLPSRQEALPAEGQQTTIVDTLSITEGSTESSVAGESEKMQGSIIDVIEESTPLPISSEEFEKLFNTFVEEAKTQYRKNYTKEKSQEPSDEIVNQYFTEEVLHQLKAELEHLIRNMTPEELEALKDKLHTTGFDLGIRLLLGAILGASVGYTSYRSALSLSNIVVPFINSFESSKFIFGAFVSIPTLFHAAACLHKLPGAFKMMKVANQMPIGGRVLQAMVAGDYLSCVVNPKEAISSVVRAITTNNVTKLANTLKKQALSEKGLRRQTFEQGYGVGFFTFQGALAAKMVWDSGILFNPYLQAAAAAYGAYAAYEWYTTSTRQEETVQ